MTQNNRIATVGQLKRLLDYFNDDAAIVLVESRYRGGDDEYYESDIVVSTDDVGNLILHPLTDSDMAEQQIDADVLTEVSLY